MNTPSHYIINLALLGQTIAPKQNVAIAIGAILPDIPIFLFYLIARYIYQLPSAKIWSEAYYEPLNQNIVALFHQKCQKEALASRMSVSSKHTIF